MGNLRWTLALFLVVACVIIAAEAKSARYYDMITAMLVRIMLISLKNIIVFTCARAFAK